MNMKRYPSSRNDLAMTADTEEEPAPEAFTEENEGKDAKGEEIRTRRGSEIASSRIARGSPEDVEGRRSTH